MAWISPMSFTALRSMQSQSSRRRLRWYASNLLVRYCHCKYRGNKEVEERGNWLELNTYGALYCGSVRERRSYKTKKKTNESKQFSRYLSTRNGKTDKAAYAYLRTNKTHSKVWNVNVYFAMSVTHTLNCNMNNKNKQLIRIVWLPWFGVACTLRLRGTTSLTAWKKVIFVN